jgi:hypothetical protein
VGFLDTILGRTKPVAPNLDALFGLPTAALTLQAAMDVQPTGTGSVCFRAAEGRAFSDIEKEVTDLLSMGSGKAQPELSQDSYGFTWLVCRHPGDDLEGLVTDLHAVNSSLEAGGFGPQLLCTLVGFRSPAGQRLGGERRDSALEMQVRGAVGSDLKIESDLSRWFPVWGAPGL